MKRSRLRHYVLDDDRQPIACDDPSEWGAWCAQDEKRRVGRTQVGAFDVSTVFLGVGYGNPPFLFETVVLESYRVREVWRRYVSWSEAEAGHADAVNHLVTQASPAHERSPGKAVSSE